jgi:hypothetical protein
MDLVTANRYSDTASVLLGEGDGSLAATTHLASVTTPYSVAAADLGDDDKQDLLTVHASRADTVSVFLQADGRPVLGKPARRRSVRHGERFRVVGTLKAQFAAGAKTVTVRAYGYVNHKWKSCRRYAAVNADAGAITRYTARVDIAKRGKYRFRAHTAATAESAPATNGFSRTLTVK